MAYLDRIKNYSIRVFHTLHLDVIVDTQFESHMQRKYFGSTFNSRIDPIGKVHNYYRSQTKLCEGYVFTGKTRLESTGGRVSCKLWSWGGSGSSPLVRLPPLGRHTTLGRSLIWAWTHPRQTTPPRQTVTPGQTSPGPDTPSGHETSLCS